MEKHISGDSDKIMKIGDMLAIKSKNKSVNRTKNRIRENGPHFILVSMPQTVMFDRSGQKWIQLESVACNCSDGRGGKEPWFGWLQMSEIELEVVG